MRSKIPIPTLFALCTIISVCVLISTFTGSGWNATTQTDVTETTMPTATDKKGTVESGHDNKPLQYEEINSATVEPNRKDGKTDNTEPLRTRRTITYTDITLTDEEVDMMLRIGMCEAGAESTLCIAHILRVVLNRVEAAQYPDNIHDVLLQPRQFSPVSSGWFYNVTPNEKCSQALEMVLTGWDETMGAIAFECVGGESWHSRNLKYLYTVDGVNFYK